MIPLLESGVAEPLKFAVHAALLGLASVACAYNAAAWTSDHERHHAVNGIIYFALAVLETEHVRHHWDALGRQAAGTLSPVEG